MSCGPESSPHGERAWEGAICAKEARDGGLSSGLVHGRVPPTGLQRVGGAPQIASVDSTNGLQVPKKRDLEPLRKHGHPALAPFPVAHDDLPILEVEVLDAQLQSLPQPSPEL